MPAGVLIKLPGLAASLALLLAACAPGQPASGTPVPNAVELNIFAAASLSAAFSEIGERFEATHPEASLGFNFAGSQQLAQQIIEGAPADVFASANMQQMEEIAAAGEVVIGTQRTFARNRLVVISTKNQAEQLLELDDLAKTGLKLVFAAEDVPVGRYSLDFLEKASRDPAYGETYRSDVLANVVSYEDNVKAVLAKIVLGEADAGIVYASDISGPEADSVNRLEIPESLNVTATYPIALLKGSKNSGLAQAFIDLVLSAEGQSILMKYNFIPAEGQ